MANKPISIEFIADVSQYLRDVKKMDVSTEDLADALVGVTNSADDLERKLGKAMKDAEKDTESLERAIKDLPDATGKAAREGAADFDKLGDRAKQTTSDFGETGKEAGSEFASNLAEGLSSGDLGSVARDTAFGLLTAFQSVPIAGQVAIGLTAAATAAYTIIKGQSEKAAAEIQTLFDLFIEEGGEAVRRAVKESGLEELGGTVAQGWQKVADLAGIIGVNTADLAATLDGDLLPAEQALVDAMKQQYDWLLNQAATSEGLTKEQSNQLQALHDILPVIESQTGEYDKAAEAAGIARDAANTPIDSYTVQQYREHWEGTRDAVNATHSNINNLPRTIPLDVNVQLTGPGASFINPNSVNYSPGLAAIYRNQQNGSSQ